MKYLLLLLCSISFAQTENISIKYNTIYFTETITNDSTYISKLLENPKIEIKGNNGFFKNAKANCKATSIFMRDEFNFDFIIYDNKVEIFNIRFNNSHQIELYGVKSSKTDTPIEDFCIKKDNKLRQNSTFNQNYQCLSNFFKNTFFTL